MTADAGPPVEAPAGTRLAEIVLWPVLAYRRWLSPVLPARCRFQPTCSAYAVQAVRERGIAVGALLGVWRVLRCHPFHPGGYQPVPPRRANRTARPSVQWAAPPSGDAR